MENRPSVVRRLVARALSVAATVASSFLVFVTSAVALAVVLSSTALRCVCYLGKRVDLFYHRMREVADS